MMREILFKAKRVDNGEWVEGYLVKTKWYINEKEMYVILPIDVCFYPHCEISEWIEVDEKTICQYTGVTDKNGQKIFEWDILRYFDDEIQVVEWSEDFANLMLLTHAERESKRGRKVVKEKVVGWNWLHDYPLNEMPIIGNVFDNPELIGGSEE